ncbi:pentapeptide repeat-containing protein [Lentzea aerocolonigenes]|uniref:pentapeptide repeat-containing protein n=1 Tax=Lentzea aerocolonigenes TaxID=68170 RepID=UPI00138DE9E4|nr:pentapeptide repeat-containing protein [Lentzea aerocolonigenes]
MAAIAGIGAGVGAIFAARTYSLNKVSAHADRYAKAVEQLASEKLEVRVGGVYALESVAKVLRGDISPVAEVLAAFVRAGSIRDSGDSASDIHAAVNVLTRGLLARIPADMTGVRFAKIQLRGNSFAKASIREGDFSMADLTRVSFQSANLQLVDFTGAKLNRVSFAGADLSGADFRGAVIEKCSFKKANTQGCRGLPVSQY